MGRVRSPNTRSVGIRKKISHKAAKPRRKTRNTNKTPKTWVRTRICTDRHGSENGLKDPRQSCESVSHYPMISTGLSLRTQCCPGQKASPDNLIESQCFSRISCIKNKEILVSVLPETRISGTVRRTRFSTSRPTGVFRGAGNRVQRRDWPKRSFPDGQ